MCLLIGWWTQGRNCMLLQEALIDICIHSALYRYKRPNSCCTKHPPNHDTSSSTFHWLLYALRVQSFPSLTMNIMFPSDPNKLTLLSSLKWALDQFASGLLILSADEREWALSPTSRHCMPRKILTLFSAELTSNSSCSVEPTALWDSLYYPVLLCICFCGWPAFLGDLNEFVTL